MPTSVRIEPSALGARATIAGAAAVALGHLRNNLFGPDVPEADITLPPAHIIAFSDGEEPAAGSAEAGDGDPGRGRTGSEALR